MDTTRSRICTKLGLKNQVVLGLLDKRHAMIKLLDESKSANSLDKRQSPNNGLFLDCSNELGTR